MNPPLRFNYPLAPQLLLPADFKNDWIQCPFTGKVGRSSQLDRMPPPGQFLQLGGAHIPESPPDAVLNATGFDPGLGPGMTEIALSRLLGHLVEMHGSIGAAVDTLSATHTSFQVDDNSPIFSF